MADRPTFTENLQELLDQAADPGALPFPPGAIVLSGDASELVLLEGWDNLTEVGELRAREAEVEAMAQVLCAVRSNGFPGDDPCSACSDTARMMHRALVKHRRTR